MSKALLVALREFLATVTTKGFIVGILLPPLLAGLSIGLMPLLMSAAAPKIEGHIAVIDRSGAVADRFAQEFTPEKMADQMSQAADKISEASPEAAAQVKQAKDGMAAAQAIMGTAKISVRVLDKDADPEKERAAILKGKDKKEGGPDTRLALVVIPNEAIVPAAGQSPAAIQILHAPKLDIRWIGQIQDAVRKGVTDARIAASGMDVDKVRSITKHPETEVKSVTETGDVKTNEVLKILLPGAFLFLMWIAVFTSGQYLLTTTIEEKSSRVMEVILSAVSPMQLLGGKIIGQGLVGLVVLLFYGGAGIAALISFSIMNLIDVSNLVYLLVYFLIAYASMACLFAAVGSAVSDMREAQSLIGPVMIIVVIPMMLWLPILQNPNSAFAQVCSFVPPISPFIMVLRLAGSEPVPTWQIPASMAFGIASVWVMAWGAAKIFRIGVLMYGKPPNFKTLLRWVWMA